MTTRRTTALIDRCHSAARAKGFWDEIPHAGQQLMLTIGELGEAQEAHRKGKKATALPPALVEHFAKYMGDTENSARTLFENTIKDTPADELADTYIRLCDYAGGFGVDVMSWQHESQATRKLVGLDAVPANFGAALLPIVQDILNINTACKAESELALASALLKLEMVCDREGIDLATHIDLKLRYNATRPDKHGKAY